MDRLYIYSVTTQVSRVHTHVLGLNASLNTLDISLYICMRTSEYRLYGHGYVMTLILIISRMPDRYVSTQCYGP